MILLADGGGERHPRARAMRAREAERFKWRSGAETHWRFSCPGETSMGLPGISKIFLRPDSSNQSRRDRRLE